MKLYLYRKAEKTVLLELERVSAYTDSRVVTEDGTVYEPLAESCELSSLPDCSETLRADWSAANLSQSDRLEALEEAVRKGLSLYEEDLGNG